MASKRGRIGDYTRAKLDEIIDNKVTTGTGDITGVTAGDGLTGGGTSGAVTVAVDYAGGDSVVMAATDGTGITVATDDKLILKDESDGSDTVKYINISQLPGTPGGSDTEVQYNNGGAFGGAASLTYNDSTGHLNVIDDKNLYFGTANESYIKYRETADNYLVISGSAKGIALSGSTIYMTGGLEIEGKAVTDLKIVNPADTGDYFSIDVGAAGATTITTVDNSSDDADLTFEIDGDIIMKPNDNRVWINDGTNNIVEFKVDDPTFKIYDDADTDNYFQINVGSNGGATVTTHDQSGDDAYLTFTIDGRIKLDGRGTEIENDSTSGYPALLIDNDDTDEIALNIVADNIDADVVSVRATALTTGKALIINHDDTATTAVTPTSIQLDFDKSGVAGSLVTSSFTGFDLDMSDAATNHANAMVDMTGLDIDVVSANAQGTLTNTGASITATGADTNIGLEITVTDASPAASQDLKIMSSADAADYFYINTGASAATTIGTIDGGATVGHMTLLPDGDLKIDPASDIARVVDDVKLTFGTGDDAFIQYRTADDYMVISGSATGLVLSGSTIALTASTSINLDVVGGAGEDINITNTGGSINLTATEDAVNAISLTSNSIYFNGGDQDDSYLFYNKPLYLDIITTPGTTTAKLWCSAGYILNWGGLGLTVTGSGHFNKTGADYDFQVQGNNDTHLLFVDGGNDAVSIGVSTDAPAAVLEIVGDSAQAKPTLSITHAEDTNNAVDITADSLTTANGIDLSTDGRTTGTALRVSDSATNDSAGSLVKIAQIGNRAGSAASVGLEINFNTEANANARALWIDSEQTTGVVAEFDATEVTTGKALSIAAAALTTGNALFINHDDTATTAVSPVSINLDFDKSGVTGDGVTSTYRGFMLDMRDAATNHANATVNMTGLDVLVDSANAQGTTTNTGININATDAAANIGLAITTTNGNPGAMQDIKIMSSADAGDYFAISTYTAGSTTILTVDDGGAEADIIFAPDGIVRINDDINLAFGNGEDAYIKYDEAVSNKLIMSGAHGGTFFSGSSAHVGALGAAGTTYGPSITTPVTALDVITDLGVQGSQGDAMLIADGQGGGEMIRLGAFESGIVKGSVVNLYRQSWGLADRSDTSAFGDATRMLAVAMDDDGGADEGLVLLRGIVRVASTLMTNYGGVGDVGDAVYLGTTAGEYDMHASLTSGDVVRIVGHLIDTDGTDFLIYFNPSPDYIILA